MNTKQKQNCVDDALRKVESKANYITYNYYYIH